MQIASKSSGTVIPGHVFVKNVSDLVGATSRRISSETGGCRRKGRYILPCASVEVGIALGEGEEFRLFQNEVSKAVL